jgi:chromosomal replication initiator protein
MASAESSPPTVESVSVVDGVLQLDVPRTSVDFGVAATAAPFVVGAENALLVPAVQRLLAAENPTDLGLQFNPLVLVGPSGSGKSHLAQGIVRAWSGRLEPAQLAYYTAADFGRERQAAEIERRLAAWRANTRAVRLLVIEDIDRIRRRATIQGELRGTVDALIAAGGVVVVTSLREPLLCESLEPGLRDRLTAGLTVRLQRPELPARRAILAHAAKARDVSLDAVALERLAQRSCAAPAQLLGRLAKATNGTSASHPGAGRAGEGGESVDRGDPSTPESSPSKAGERSDLTHAPAIKQILAVTARYFGVTQAALISSSRRTSLVEARNIVVHIARRLTCLSYADIGRALGNRDHSTIMHGERRLIDRLAVDSTTRQAVDELDRILSS